MRNYKSKLFLFALFIFIFLSFLVSDLLCGVESHAARFDSKRIPIAVLGDSDSHSYRDKFDSVRRGGDYHSQTYNWFELMAMTLGNEINPGEWGVWGNKYRITRIKNFFGIKSRSPTKLDYEFNYAVSGLTCKSLLSDWPYQAKWLLNEIKSYPEFWAKGVVVIRIGINDFGNKVEVMKWSENSLNDQAKSLVSGCISEIKNTTEKILSLNTGVKVALVGMTRSYNFKGYCCQNLSKQQVNNIEVVLSEFDNSLKLYASKNSHIAYIDDHFWFNEIFGSQESSNLKSEINFSTGIQLRNSAGDHPSNMILKDYHAGTLYSALWLNHMVKSLNRQLNLGISYLEIDEVLQISGLGGTKTNIFQ